MNKVILNGVLKYLTDDEVEYLKKLYGDWEKHQDVWVFTRMDFVDVSEIAKMLELTENAVYQRHLRDPKRYPLREKGKVLGVDADEFLRKWI